jgi:hypothetical protein
MFGCGLERPPAAIPPYSERSCPQTDPPRDIRHYARMDSTDPLDPWFGDDRASQIAEPLRHFVNLLHRAYPTGIPPAEYAAALVLLSDHLSERNLGQVFWAYAGTEAAVAQNDAARALSIGLPTRAEKERVRALFERADEDGVLLSE